MKISPEEFVALINKINNSNDVAYKNGVKTEKERELPNNLFEALLKYGKKSMTLLAYHKSSDKSDGCNWIQLKPLRSPEYKHLCVEVSFNRNLTEIDYIGISKIE